MANHRVTFDLHVRHTDQLRYVHEAVLEDSLGDHHRLPSATSSAAWVSLHIGQEYRMRRRANSTAFGRLPTYQESDQGCF